MGSGKMIDSAKECSGLYLLTSTNSPSKQALKVGSPSLNCSFVMLLFLVSIMMHVMALSFRTS